MPSRCRSDATGELIPSCEIAVGTLMKSVPVRDAASLAVSITRPPPTPTTSETPSEMMVAAISAAWSSRPSRLSIWSTSTSSARSPDATLSASALEGPVMRRPGPSDPPFQSGGCVQRTTCLSFTFTVIVSPWTMMCSVNHSSSFAGDRSRMSTT